MKWRLYAMKKHIIIMAALLLVFIGGCALPANSTNFEFSISTANITSPFMTSDVVNGEPVDEVTEYPKDAPKLVAVGILNNAPDDTKVRFVWNYITDDQMIYEVEMNNEGQSGIYVYSTLTIESLWPDGEYSVDMYVDNRTEPDATAFFKIR